MPTTPLATTLLRCLSFSISFALFTNLLLQVSPSKDKPPQEKPHLPYSPSGNYEPTVVTCPPGLGVRLADQYPWPMSPGEETYVREKAKKSVPQWERYLNQVRLQDFNVSQFLEAARDGRGVAGETVPNIGIATSGGGNRALLFGGSMMDALDARNPEAVRARIAGPLQLANYVTGLSAGAWLLTSWAAANFERITELNRTAWGIDQHKGYVSWNTAKSFPKHYFEIRRKKKAGFDISFVDMWGRMLSSQYLDDPEDGRSLPFSSIKETPAYKDRGFPLPIITALSRKASGVPFTLQCPIYEISPEDFSIWSPYLNASIPTEYLGSRMSYGKGKAVSCVKGFDNAGFLMGTSSNVFSFQDGSNLTPNLGEKLVNLFLKGTFYEALVPNPFYGQSPGASPSSGGFDDFNKETLLLADAAMAEENIPFFPFLQPARKVDVVIALDATVNGRPYDAADVDGYPNGTALYQTYRKLQHPDYRNYNFPEIPNSLTSEFIVGGLNKRPVFFGCEMKAGPMIVYLPNYFASDRTDMETMRTDYTAEEIDGFFRNSFLIASQQNSTLNDPEWPECLACALIDRQRQRSRLPQTPQCQRCFSRYCA